LTMKQRGEQNAKNLVEGKEVTRCVKVVTSSRCIDPKDIKRYRTSLCGALSTSDTLISSTILEGCTSAALGSFGPHRCVNGDISSKNNNDKGPRACWFVTALARPNTRRRRYDDHDHDVPMALFRLPAQCTSPSQPYHALFFGKRVVFVVSNSFAGAAVKQVLVIRRLSYRKSISENMRGSDSASYERSLRRLMSAIASRLVRFAARVSLEFVVAFVIGRSLVGSRPAVAWPETTIAFRESREMKYQVMSTMLLRLLLLHSSSRRLAAPVSQYRPHPPPFCRRRRLWCGLDHQFKIGVYRHFYE
jgi:hypothetical protein